MANYNPDLFNAVTAYLDSQHFIYDTNPDAGTVTLEWNFSTSTAIKRARIQFDITTNAICVTNQPEIPEGSLSIANQVPTDDTDRLADAMIFLTAVNYNRIHYAFQLDPRTGTVNSTSSLYCGAYVPPAELIDNVFRHANNAWEINGDEFINVLEHHKDPLAAADDAEALTAR